MNEKQQAIWERNQELMNRFRELDANPEATAQDWEILAGHYIEAGYYLNAGTCFTRADAIKDRAMKYRNDYSVSTKRILAAVGAPWDKSTVEA